MKTSVRSLLLTLTLTLTAVSARAQTPTVITSLPYTISTGGIYVLNSNLGSTQTSGNLISVNSGNVTIDFQNHYITGPVGSTTLQTNGVSASSRSNVTIKNGTVAHCRTGIVLQGNGDADANAADALVDNMRVTSCTYTGIYVVGCPAARITNCQVSQTGYSGSGGAGAIYNATGGATITNCIIGTVTAGTNSYGMLLGTGSFARQNTVADCAYGIYGGKYQDNLFNNCTTPFSNGVDAGGNN